MNAQDKAMVEVLEQVMPTTEANREALAETAKSIEIFRCELDEVKRANGLLSGRVVYLEGQNETIAELLRGLCNAYVDLASRSERCDDAIKRTMRWVTA